jgi:hypothetical protein
MWLVLEGIEAWNTTDHYTLLFLDTLNLALKKGGGPIFSVPEHDQANTLHTSHSFIHLSFIVKYLWRVCSVPGGAWEPRTLMSSAPLSFWNRMWYILWLSTTLTFLNLALRKLTTLISHHAAKEEPMFRA